MNKKNKKARKVIENLQTRLKGVGLALGLDDPNKFASYPAGNENILHKFLRARLALQIMDNVDDEFSVSHLEKSIQSLGLK